MFFHIFVFFLLYMHASVSIAFDVLHVHVTYRYQCREWDADEQCSKVYTSKNTTKLNSTIICICCNFLGMTWFLLCHHDNFKFQFVPNIKKKSQRGLHYEANPYMARSVVYITGVREGEWSSCLCCCYYMYVPQRYFHNIFERPGCR